MSKANPLSGKRRRRPLSSRTVDTLFHILSLCYADSSHIIQNSEKGIRIDVPLNCTNNSPFQEEASMDETRVILDTHEDLLYNKRVESSEHDHNILKEKKGPSQKVNFEIRSQDNNNNNYIICASPHLPTNENVEEGENSGDYINDTKTVGETDSDPRDFIGTKTGLKNDDNLITLFTKEMENGGKDLAGALNRSTRNLVDYSELAYHAKSQESLKQATLKMNAIKNQDLVSAVKVSNAQNNKKRPGSCSEEERRNKKSKQSVDPPTCPENLTLLVNASQEAIDSSANKAPFNEKKRKRVVTKERKAKKKMKERIKRAEKNRKLGIRRLKLQPVIKEKKITYCRHYMNGRCHEGEKCKFSHDTIPLTKSKPCCHFARHTCMKGDDCPYDHQLSKYPCNNYQTKGSCNRGSDCMFSHEAQPNEASLNESNKSKPEQKPCIISSSKQIETKSVLVPKFVDITPKSIRPPKGINFVSQEKLPLESRISPKIDSEVKEITKMPLLIQDSKEKAATTPLVQGSVEITKTPTVVPRGINFLSFGKKPGLDYSNGGYSFKISNRVEKSRDVVGSSVNLVNEVKVDVSTDRSSCSKDPMPVMSFMSSASQNALQSTLAFASELEVKSKF